MSGRFERPAAPPPTTNGSAPDGTAPISEMPRVAGSEEMSRDELQRRRDALARELAERQWDLGGLAYEMAIRDHFRLVVLVRKAADLQQVDAELGELERILTLRESRATGLCSACGAPHSGGAVFCWQCGAQLMTKTASPGTA
jgi:hypothetical protein